MGFGHVFETLLELRVSCSYITVNNKEDGMSKYVFVSDNGDDKNDGLDENRPVRSAASAIKISLKTGREIRMLDNWEAVGRHGKDLEEERKAA